jgi:hypothetical protein
MKHRRDAGFSLAALVFIATAVSILLSAAYPAYQMQAKRQTEEELIFRGEEYTRAIQKFYRKFGVYPPSVDALVQTNGLRFIRRVYKDPITGKDFRLISISPDGTLLGSTLPTQRMNNTPLFGAPLQTLGSAPQSQNQAPRGNTNQAPGSNTGLPNTGSTPGVVPPPEQLNPNFVGGIVRPPQQQGAPPQPAQQPSAFRAPTGGASGTAGIVGVGSDSMGESIKVYNQRQKYNEWEFIAIMTPNPQAPGAPPQPGTGTPAPPGTPPQGGPAVPGNPTAPAGNPTAPPGNPSNPFQTPSQPPFKRP